MGTLQLVGEVPERTIFEVDGVTIEESSICVCGQNGIVHCRTAVRCYASIELPEPSKKKAKRIKRQLTSTPTTCDEAYLPPASLFDPNAQRNLTSINNLEENRDDLLMHLRTLKISAQAPLKQVVKEMRRLIRVFMKAVGLPPKTDADMLLKLALTS